MVFTCEKTLRKIDVKSEKLKDQSHVTLDHLSHFMLRF